MCAGAVINCRPERVVFGAEDPRCGAGGGWINLLESNPPLNHRCEVTRGVMGAQCLELLQQFFRDARERKKNGDGRNQAEATFKSRPSDGSGTSPEPGVGM